MPLDLDKLRRELARVRRPRSATITPMPGGSPVEVSVGDEVEFDYEGETRRVRVLAITHWGLRAWDEVKSRMRGFSFTKIGAAERPPETDEAASG